MFGHKCLQSFFQKNKSLVIITKANKLTTEDYIIKLGKRIKELRIKNEMTQFDLSIKIDIDPTALRRYEKGKVEMGFTTLIKFAEVFEIPIDELLSINLSS